MERDSDLTLKILNCQACPLSETRNLAVPAEVGADYQPGGLAFLAEAPGAQEDATGRPLVGPTGRLFNGLLGTVAIERASCVLLNVVRCRPPRNRLAGEKGASALHNCGPWLRAELDAYNPSIVVVMGKYAITKVFSTAGRFTVGGIRGTLRQTGEGFEYGARLWVPTYHPASLLGNRSPQNRPLVVEDFELAKELLYDRG